MSAPPRAHPPQEGVEGWVMELQDQEVGMMIHSSATLQSTLVAGRRVRKVGVIWSYDSPIRRLATTREERGKRGLKIRGWCCYALQMPFLAFMRRERRR